MTACGDCKFHRVMMLCYFCIAGEKDVFDCVSGKFVKEYDMRLFPSFPAYPVYCHEKNKGECPDFQPISKGVSNERY